jgi:hypothetical protein
MDQRTAARVLELLAATPSVRTVDVTGGAPELNPNFRDIVVGAGPCAALEAPNRLRAQRCGSEAWR